MPSLHALCLAQLALLSLEQDDWEQAGRLATKATTALERHGLSEVVTLGPVYAISALVLAQQRREGEAQRHAQHARRMIELAHLAPWFSTQAKIVLSRAHVLLGDSAAACVLLSETRRQLTLTPDASVLGEWFDATRRMVEGLPLASHVGRSSLTTAEIRVLHYLPTYLSFQEIGNRLHVSRNTVKTQAISAYRKLGVTSRREAVEHAHVLGLIRA